MPSASRSSHGTVPSKELATPSALNEPSTSRPSAGLLMLTRASDVELGARANGSLVGTPSTCGDRPARWSRELHGQVLTDRGLQRVDDLLRSTSCASAGTDLGRPPIRSLSATTTSMTPSTTSAPPKAPVRPECPVVGVVRRRGEQPQRRVQRRDGLRPAGTPGTAAGPRRLAEVVRRDRARARRPAVHDRRLVGRTGARVGRGLDGDRDRGDHGRGRQDSAADGVPAARARPGLRASADLAEPVGRLDVVDGVVEQGGQVVHHRSPLRWSASSARSVAEPREACALTEPRLMPRASAISASDSSR